MSRRKRQYRPKPWESLLPVGGRFRDAEGREHVETMTQVAESMLLSPAFMSLTDRQKVLYLYAKSQYYGKRKPGADYKDIEQMRQDGLFYLSWAAVQQYGLYKPTMHSNFYRDVKALRDHGLIEVFSSGARRRSKTVYRYSSGWKNWG